MSSEAKPVSEKDLPTKVQAPIRKRRGRPPKYLDEKQKRLAQVRVPVDGMRDQTAIEGKDPNYYYRWVLDSQENGTNILRHQRAGYIFCDVSERLIIGEDSVYRHDNVGSIIRIPAGKSEGYLYLMKQPMTFRKEDLAAKAKKIDDTEQSLNYKEDGQYGGLKIERSSSF